MWWGGDPCTVECIVISAAKEDSCKQASSVSISNGSCLLCLLNEQVSRDVFANKIQCVTYKFLLSQALQMHSCLGGWHFNCILLSLCSLYEVGSGRNRRKLIRVEIKMGLSKQMLTLGGKMWLALPRTGEEAAWSNRMTEVPGHTPNFES